MNITELLPLLERFINNTGFPIAMLLIIGYIVKKAAEKVYEKIVPVVDSHLELVLELKNTSVEQVNLMDKQNQILLDNFEKHGKLLENQSLELKEIKSLYNPCLASSLNGQKDVGVKK